MNELITSDWHIGHKNIAPVNTTVWNKGFRNFNSLEEHDSTIINNFNTMSSLDAVVYYLGDLTFKGGISVKHILDQLIFKEFHWILGNHDKWANKLYSQGITNLSIIGYPNVFLHKYLELRTVNKEDKEMFLCLFHYPIGSWNHLYRGAMHFHGHSHDSYNPVGKMLDVGVDTAYRLLAEYRPFYLEEAMNILEKKEIKFVDHHDENTK